MDRRDSGARLRSTRSQYASEKGSSTMRNIVPGYADGIKSLGKGIVSTDEGIYEQEESIYNLSEQNEEAKLFQLNDSISNLLESLENTNEITTEHQDEN